MDFFLFWSEILALTDPPRAPYAGITDRSQPQTHTGGEHDETRTQAFHPRGGHPGGVLGCKKSSSPEITGIVVTLRPQAGTNIDVNNARVQVYSDASFQNLVAEKAAIGSATEARCTLEVAAGTYYVAAWKDMDNSGSVTSGDFWGEYTNDLGQPLGITVSAGQLKAISFTIGTWSGSGGGTGGVLSGTAVLSGGTGDLRGARVAVYASPADWNNDNVLDQQAGQGMATQISFRFSLPAGTYYLDVFKDNGDGSWGTAGDLIGVYDDQNLYDGQWNLVPITVEDGQETSVQVTVFLVQ